MKTDFIKLFGATDAPIRHFFAPGRVNLIGEHIDYNGGEVMPGAISRGITGLYRKRNDKLVKFASLNEPGVATIDLDQEISYNQELRWCNYPAGVFKMIQDEGVQLEGCEILFSSNLPEGAGLSSSAALEVLTAFIAYRSAGIEPERVKLSLLAQKVENQFVGVNCGIMDQFAVAMGKKDQAIQLNTGNLEYSYSPFKLQHHVLMIMNTCVSRELADSKYNQRRSECEQALAIIRQHKDIANLVDAELSDLDHIEDEILKKRARHVISEQQRVIRAAEVLKQDKLDQFGQLLNASHASLKNDYEVSGDALDAIVAAAQQAPGCLGARMTGAGFGGCALAIVEAERAESFIMQVSAEYKTATGIDCEIFPSTIEEGVRELS